LQESINIELEWLKSRLKYYKNDCHIKGSYRHCSSMTEKFASRIYKIKTNPELYFKEKRIRDRNNKEKRVVKTQDNNNPQFINSPPKGVIDVNTGIYYPPVAGGVIDPTTGTFHQKVGGGYINSQTGEFSPSF